MTEVVAGVDEAGRGPLAGPVYAACVVLDPARPIQGLRDSKALSAATRERLADLVRSRARAWSVAQASAAEVDDINVLQAALLAMRRAVHALGVTPTLVLVDGPHCPQLAIAARGVVGGDRRVAEISAASILAKTARDAEMLNLHRRYPEYGFDRHKGYPTAEHLAALRRLGPCPEHRVSFGPVRSVLGSAPQSS